MRRIPYNFVAVLLIISGGVCLRLLIGQGMCLPGDSDLPSQVPYRIGDYAGSDLETAGIVAGSHGLSLRGLVLRRYRSGTGREVELYAVARLMDLPSCFKYDGWAVNFERNSRLASAPLFSAHEFVALSPSGEPGETDACVSYWRGEREALSLTPGLVLRAKLAQLAGREPHGISVELCGLLADKSGDPRPTFATLESFALLLDPYLQAAPR